MERAWMTRRRVCFFLFLVLLLACGSLAAELYDFEDARFDPDMVGIICSLGGVLLCLAALLVVRRGTVVASEGGLRADAWRATLLRSGGLLRGCLFLLMLLAVAAFAASLYDFEDMRVDIDMPDALFPLAAFFLLSWLRYRIRVAAAHAGESPAAPASQDRESRAVPSHEHARMAQELEELKKRVEIDPLTGLLNKAALTEKITQSLHGDDTHCALFMVDMDNFKSINDTYGHQAGDTALVRTGEALREALDKAAAFDKKILVEEFIDGREVEVAVLGNETPAASTCGEIDSGVEFYDYEAKYITDTSTLYIPARISEEASETVRETAVRIYEALGCRGLSRVDFFVTRDGEEVVFNEINTLPGFTSISMYPKLFEASGIAYGDLIDQLLQLAMEE